MVELPNPLKFGKYYNTQPNFIPFRTKGMRKTMWRLEQDKWHVYFTLNGQWYCLIIFRKYVCDLASIPWLAQPLLRKGKDGVHRSFAGSHDYPYVLPKIMVNGELMAYIAHKTCAHELYSFVDGKWIATDITMSKREADDMAFQVWNSTPETHSAKWKKRVMAAAFRTFVAHRLWRQEWTFNQINPKQCSDDA